MCLTSFVLNISIQLICIGLSLGMIVFFFFKNSKPPVVYPFIFCLSMISIWSFGQLLQALSDEVISLWLYEVFKHIGICYIGFGWFLFCVYYTEHKLLNNKPVIFILFILSTISFASILTNDLHYRFYPFFKYSPIDTGRLDFGILLYYHVTVSYLNCLIGSIILYKYSIRSFGYNRKQSVLLIIAVLITMLTSIIITFDFIQPDFDITPTAFAVSLFIFGIAIIKYKFLNIMPVAMRSVFDSMKESILIVNSSGIIANYNKSFENDFQALSGFGISDYVQNFIKELSLYIEKTEDANRVLDCIGNLNDFRAFVGELNLMTPISKSFVVNITPIFSDKTKCIGKVISFNDITTYKKLLEDLAVKNTQLSVANTKLKEHTFTIEKLTVERERMRFARDAHDYVGHSMTLLITLLKLAQVECLKNPQSTYDKLSEALKISRDGLNKLRNSISGLVPENFNGTTIIEAVSSLLCDIESMEVETQLTIKGEEGKNCMPYCSTIYRVCQEAVTNSIRHGKANKIHIIVVFNIDNIKLFIFDNGIGCKVVKKGFGIREMEKRVKLEGGNIIYGSNDDGGFNINVEIPIGSDVND